MTPNAALRELRLWHWRQAIYCAKQYSMYAALDSERRFEYMRGQTLHMNAVTALNTLFGPDDTADEDDKHYPIPEPG